MASNLTENFLQELPINSKITSNATFDASSLFIILTNSTTNQFLNFHNDDVNVDQSNQTFLFGPLCTEIEQTLQKPAYLAILHANLVVLAVTLISIGFLVQKYAKERIIIHGNLVLLFANVVLLYSIHNFANFICLLRYRVLLLVYSDACQLLTPFWLVSLLYGPSCVYMIAYPALHFCVMIERIRATLLAGKYEREGQKLGIFMVLSIWSISLGFAAFVICTDLADPEISGHPQGVIYLTSKQNAAPIFYASIFTLLLVISTAIFDWRITLLNRRVRAMSQSFFANYSLSRNYQLKENVLAMRLILPLDISYALFYSLYNALVILIRGLKAEMSTPEYYFYYDLANMLLFVHSAVTILVYIRFIRFVKSSQKRTIKSRPVTEHGRIYFNQLAAQWG